MSRSTLSNCYTPERAIPQTTLQERQAYLLQNRNNGDGEPRTKDTLRRLVLETSILTNFAGSCLVELGHTKVLGQLTISVDGNHALIETGFFIVRVNQVAIMSLPSSSSSSSTTGVSSLDTAAQSGGSNNNNSTARKSHAAQGGSVDLEARIHTALSPALQLINFPKTVLQLDITVLQNDGSLLSACMLAATLALIDARVELYDVVTCCEVVIVNRAAGDSATASSSDGNHGLDYDLLVDPTLEEECAADAKLTLAIMPQWKEVTLWQQSGTACSSSDAMKQGKAIEEAMQRCLDGCRTLQRFVRQHLLDKAQE